MHRSWAVGDVRVTQVRERLQLVDVGMFGGADVAALERHRRWLHPHFIDEQGNLTLSIHALVVESMTKRIVVDTCVGDRVVPGMEGLSNQGAAFLDELRGAGFDPDSIDVVLCTHLHFDHVGWNTRLVDGQWVPTFPNARYLFGRVEYEHWSTTDGLGYASTFGDAVKPVVDAGLADLVDVDHEITPQVRLVSTPGHTPGHVSVAIESSGQRALITGDLVHHPVQFAEAEWKMVADSDPARAVATRKAFRQRARHDGALVFGTHFGGPGCGHVRVTDGGWWFEAAR